MRGVCPERINVVPLGDRTAVCWGYWLVYRGCRPDSKNAAAGSHGLGIRLSLIPFVCCSSSENRTKPERELRHYHS